MLDFASVVGQKPLCATNPVASRPPAATPGPVPACSVPVPVRLILSWLRSSLPQGKPRPVVTWLKDGVPLEDRSVGTRTSEVDSILFIRSAERRHSGTYTLSVQIENMLDSADIRIQVVGGSHRLAVLD